MLFFYRIFMAIQDLTLSLAGPATPIL